MKAKLERSGAGEIILFIHGAGGNANSWLYQTKGLKSQCEVIAVDLPGHGMASVGKGCTSIKEYRDSIQDTLSSSGIDKCFMVGHSMGGAIAMSFAMTFPDTVKGIVLVSTGAKLKVFPQILEGLMKDKENTLNSIIEHAISKNAPDTLKMGYFEEMMKCSPEVIYGDFLACDRCGCGIDLTRQPRLDLPHTLDGVLDEAPRVTRTGHHACSVLVVTLGHAALVALDGGAHRADGLVRVVAQGAVLQDVRVIRLAGARVLTCNRLVHVLLVAGDLVERVA